MPVYDLSERTVAAIARRIIETREALGMNQAQICRETGIQTSTYNQWEKEKGRPEIDHAHRLCDGLGVTLDWIYRGDRSGLPARILEKLPPPPRPEAPTRPQSRRAARNS